MKISKTEISIPFGSRIHLKGNLNIPDVSRSIVIFSHGSGSSRFSSRNNFVASELNKAGICTLLIDLLTVEEDFVYENRFNINLITERLIQVTNYMKELPEFEGFSIGYFGASTGAASALRAAAKLNDVIKAVVSRGGRPDLAEGSLKEVTAPTLLIIGSLDTEVISLNQIAYYSLLCEKKIEIVNGASHLFEESGTLAEVARLAKKWFKEYL